MIEMIQGEKNYFWIQFVINWNKHKRSCLTIALVGIFISAVLLSWHTKPHGVQHSNSYTGGVIPVGGRRICALLLAPVRRSLMYCNPPS